MCLCIAETSCTHKKVKKKNIKAVKAKEGITEKDKRLLDWEKVNALQYMRKDRIAQQEKLDNRVVLIEDRCVWKNDILHSTAVYIFSLYP